MTDVNLLNLKIINVVKKKKKNTLKKKKKNLIIIINGKRSYI